MSDLLADLNEWLKYGHDEPPIVSLIQRCRDEIMILLSEREERSAKMVEAIISKRLISTVREATLEDVACLLEQAGAGDDIVTEVAKRLAAGVKAIK